MKKIQATDRARATLNALKQRKGVVITQSYLRLEQTLGTQGSVTFNVLVNQGAQNANEKRLNITDAFSITSLAMLIYKVPNGSAISSGVLDTFPNPLTYSAAGEADALQALYNGYATVRVNSTIFIDSLDLYRFYRAGVAQRGLDVSAGANPAYVASSWERGDYPFYQLTPGIRLSGATKNELTITLPESVNMAGTLSTNRVVLYLRGFLEQNGAQFQAAK